MNERDQKIPIVELFAGIAGFGLGFKRQGFQSVVQVEIDKNCRQLLKSKFPVSVRITDVRSIAAMHKRQRTGRAIGDEWRRILELLRTAPVWCGGFPCQDLSVAGQRAGLAGERSGLWFSFRRLVALFRPAWVVIENVPGLLSSSQGRDLAVILSGLAQLRYRWAYRILDAQYCGLAQRRERVFIVASLGSFSCAQVLFEPESLCWDSPPSRETGKRITGTFSARSSAGGGFGTDFEIGGGGLIENTESTKPMQPKSGQRNVYSDDISYCLNGGGMGRIDGESETFVTAYNIHSQNSCAMQGAGPSKAALETTVARALDSQGFTSSQGGTVALGPTIAFPQNLSATQCASTEEVSPVLQSENPTAVAVGHINLSNQGNGGNRPGYNMDEPHPTLSLNSESMGAVAFTERTRADGRNFESQEEVSYALTNPGSGGRTHSRQIATQSMVRRLTPTECERLQGFPDGWTEGFSDSVRYRMLGNAVAVPVAEFIAKRLRKAMRETHP